MKILLLGSGGREHALAWRLRRDDPGLQLFTAPGNAGAANSGTNLPLGATDLDGLVAWALREKPDLTVVGPEAPLCAGVVDRFERAGLPIFGPNAAAARLEGSKVFTKNLLLKHGLPTAPGACFTTRFRLTPTARSTMFIRRSSKADGLAAGKGVIIAQTPREAAQTHPSHHGPARLWRRGRELMIEEFLLGCAKCRSMCSPTAFPTSSCRSRRTTSGSAIGDTGPNTGGMVRPTPRPFATVELQAQISQRDRRAGTDGVRSRKESTSVASFISASSGRKAGPGISSSTCAAAIPNPGVPSAFGHAAGRDFAGG